MKSAIIPAVEFIRTLPIGIGMILTGGGSAAIARLTERGGASAVFVGGYVPYSTDAMDIALGFKPDKYTSRSTSYWLAHRAYDEVRRYGWEDKAVGIGLSASLARHEEEREGRTNEVYAVRVDSQGAIGYHAVVTQHLYPAGSSRRNKQEDMASLLPLLLLLERTESPHQLRIHAEIESMGVTLERFEAPSLPAPDTLDFRGGDIPSHLVVLPGSFNPVHDGHLAMYRFLAEKFNVTPWVEITIVNRRKPPIDAFDLHNRLTLLNSAGVSNVIVSGNHPLFEQKRTALLNRAKEITFGLGYDTYAQMVIDNRSEAGWLFNTNTDTNTPLFVVFGRQQDEEFLTGESALAHSPIADFFREKSLFLTREQFALNISSTQVREINAAKPA